MRIKERSLLLLLLLLINTATCAKERNGKVGQRYIS